MIAARAAWLNKARPEQLTPDGDWSTWLILAGRGWGKTRTGAEDAAWFGMSNPGARIAVVAPTYADARDTCVEGESGLRGVLPKQAIEAWNRSLGELILVNGSRYKLFAAEEPERLRGPQHHRAWADELGAWRYSETWDQLLFGLRLGDDPRAVVTTTPRPTPLIRALLKSPRTQPTRGSTFDNAANLAPAALAQLRERYEGTRLGRQELNAELLDDVPGALWTRDMIEAAQLKGALPDMQRVVVAIDPSGTRGSEDAGDSIGIVVCGKGVDGRGYVLADRSCKLSPDGWGRRAVEAYREFKADRIVAERNFGGAMVEHVIRTVDRTVSYAEVVASRGKVIRAEPVAALYEQKRVSHVTGLSDLEDQMCVEIGTLIETDRGQIPVEDVTVKDRVLTRDGFAPLKWAGYTGCTDELIEFATRNSVLRVTSCHPIFSQTKKKFVSAINVCRSDSLLESPNWANTDLRSLGAVGGITACLRGITAMRAGSSSIEKSSRLIVGRYLTDMMSIIGMRIRQTINPSIWLPSPALSITESIGGSVSTCSPMSPLANVSSAARKQKPLGCNPIAIAQTDAPARLTVVGRPVFNLSVAEGFLPEYFANGILTHNCAMASDGYLGDGSPDRLDAAVWGLSELMLSGSTYTLAHIA